MERRMVKSAGLRVSALTFGGMSLGGAPSYAGFTIPDDDARRVFDAALDAGIDSIDTANIYSDGLSETCLGHWLAGRRSNVQIFTKCGFPSSNLPRDLLCPGEAGLSRHTIIKACEASLQRLATDYIDVLQLHIQDATVPIDETLSALDSLVHAGKVRYVGCSNFTAYRLVESLWTADRRNLTPLISIQLPWSLVMRDAERELVPTARAFGLGLFVYSPLARGFLTGKYQRDEKPPPGSRLEYWPQAFNEYDPTQSWDVLDAVVEMARCHETTCAAIAIAWLLAKAETTTVIIGVRSEKQLRENLAAISVTLSPDEIASLDRLSEPKWGYPYSLIGRNEVW